MKRFIFPLLFFLAICASSALSAIPKPEIISDLITSGTEVDMRMFKDPAHPFGNLSTAKVSAKTAGKTIVVSTGTVNVNNLTIPSNRGLKVLQGGLINVANGKKLAIPPDGYFYAGDYQAFTGGGTVTGLKEVRPELFGAKGNGVDCTAAMHAAISSLGDYGTVLLSPGTYKFNVDIGSKKINFRGAGLGKTIITSKVRGSAPIVIGSNASWDFLQISDLTIAGASGARTDIGVQFGHSVYASNDEYGGRVIFHRVKFIDLNKCIARMYGNIGVYFDGCYFSNANYHLWAKGQASPIMHAGNMIAHNSHFDSAQLASVYVDSPVIGTGQVIFDGCIMENNPGFVYFIKNFLDLANGEGFIVRGCWNENNYTASSVTIDGAAYTPRHLYAKNTPHLRFEDVTMGPVELVNSNFTTDNCQLDFMTLSMDSRSSCFHDNAVYDSGKNNCGVVRSVKNMNRAAGSFASIATTTHRQITSKAWAAILYQELFAAPITFTGTTSRNSTNATDGVLSGQTTVQDLVLNAGESELPTGGIFNINANKYVVWYLTYKLVSGVAPAFDIAYSTSLVSGALLNQTRWTTIAGITNTIGVSGLPNTVALYLTGIGTCTLRMAGFAVVEFNTKQEALEFLNSNTHPIP